MKRVIKANPVDIQDRNGFRNYLSQQAKNGLQPILIRPACTVFEKVDNPHRNYDILFVGGDMKAYPNNLCRMNNGIVIVPDDGAQQWSSWWEDISSAYDRIFLNHRFVARGKFIATLTRLVVPLVALAAMPYWLGGSALLSEAVIDSGVTAKMIAAVVALFVYTILKYMLDSLAGQVERRHLEGIRQAIASGQIYRTPEELEQTVLRKNRLLTWCSPLLVLMLVICAVIFI